MGIIENSDIEKIRKAGRLRGLLFLMALCALFCVLRPFPALSSGEADTVTITDSRGVKVSFKKDPQRIVTLSFSSLEIVRLLGAVDKVVAVGTARKGTIREQSVPELENMVPLGSGNNPDLELLISSNPDLVITWGSYPGGFLERALDPFGIKVLRLDFYKPKNFNREVRALAEILGGEAIGRAEEYIAWNLGCEEKIKTMLRGVSKGPTAIVEHPYDGRLAGRDSGVFQLTEMLKVDNLGGIFKENAAMLDSEWILTEDPEFITRLEHLEEASTLEEQDMMVRALYEKLRARPGWDELRAYKENKIIVMDGDLATGPRYTVGLFFLGSFFYPDLVLKDEYKRINKEYFQRFQGIEVE
jgi:iron complex transport system substrate-binding protein